MSIVLKDKIKADKSFIADLIAKSWEDSESIQNQINSIDIDSTTATKVVQLLKDLLTSYYVFTGCLENLENELAEIPSIEPTIEPEVIISKKLTVAPEEPAKVNIQETELNNIEIEPFEYFVDFDDPVGEPLTDDDLYNN